ncbi:MAG: Ig-like domain-containing domain, partial [Thermoanaerobaculia bacterium]
APVAGAALAGVADPCADGGCSELAGRPLRLDPPTVLPTERSVATVEVDGAVLAGVPAFASGTAVQAYIDEELQLTDGTKLIDPPFATDLILYRTLDGAAATAEFHIQPSSRAADVVLNVGYDHIRLHPYPGRLDRGTLIGVEGGRVAGDEGVTIEVPAGAATEPLHVRAASLPSADLAAIHIEGFEVLGGFALELARAANSSAAPLWPKFSTSAAVTRKPGSSETGDTLNEFSPELIKPARAIVTPSTSVTADEQLILVELLDGTSYGTVPRLAALCAPLDGSSRVTTGTIDRAVLPVDGVVRDGRYILLRAVQPIAFAKGLLGRSDVHLHAWAPLSASDPTPRQLGTADVVRPNAVFALPVPSAPAAAFRLVPRHASFGEAETYIHPAAPARGEVVEITTLPINPRRLALLAVTPADAATEVLIGTTITATFDATLDRASFTDALLVHDLSNGQQVAGAIADGAGSSITWVPSQPLTANRRYGITIAGTIRSAAGALFGETHVTSFSTVSKATNNSVNPDRIRITIPDENGVSRVIGASGALPANWLALAVRKGRDFIVKPSATAASDGSFSITLGTDPADRVTIRDSIELHVTDTYGILQHILPLTPFVSTDGKSFIAPPDRESKFTSSDGITVTVPAGAFDDFTTVTLQPATAESFASVPSFSEELGYVNAVGLSFEGTAKKRLQLEFPLGAADPNIGPYVVGELFESRRGPRVAIADSLRIVGNRLTTAPEPASLSDTRLSASAIVVRDDVKAIMSGVRKAGVFAAVVLPDDTVWTVVERLETSVELLLDIFRSIGVPSSYLVESGGRAVVPVRLGAEFAITGVDVEGFDRFTIRRSASNDPGAIIVIDDPGIDQKGPYPVFATPNRVEMVAATNDLSVPGGRLTLDRGTLYGHFAPTRELRAGTTVRAFNASVGALSAEIRLDAEGEVALSLADTKPQDRIVLWYGATEADPATSISIVFSEPLSRPASDS